MVVRVGTSSTGLPLRAGFTLTGALRRVGEGRVLVPTVVVED